MIRMRFRRATSSRAGWQLIELSMTIAVLAIVSIVATKLIVALMALETRSSRMFHDAAALARLGEQWRSDVHRTIAATIADDGQSCELQRMGGTTVVWRIDRDQLRREERVPGRQHPLRGSYRASARNWRFENEGRLLSVIRDSSPGQLTGTGAASSPALTDRIDGALGTFQADREGAAQ